MCSGSVLSTGEIKTPANPEKHCRGSAFLTINIQPVFNYLCKNEEAHHLPSIAYLLLTLANGEIICLPKN